MLNLRKLNRKGFSLLEVLVAVAIMASAFTILLTGQGASFLASERGEMLTMATNLARQKMTELEMEIEADLAKNKFPSEDEEKNGSFDEPFENFRWVTTVKKVEIPLAQGAGEGEEEQGGMIGSYMQTVMEQISESVRELQVQIFWGDKDTPIEDQPKMVLTTHTVKLK